MLKTRLFIFLLTFGALLALVPSLSLNDVGKKASKAEAAPATNILLVSQDCISSTQLRITLQWNASGDGQQWIDLSLQNNNFAPNTFISLGPLAPNQNTAVWEGLLPSMTHYLRINTNVGGNWQPSGTVFWTTPSCAGFQGVTNLRLVSQECLLDGTVRINLAWEAIGQGTQFVDLSLQNNGFAPNTFVGLGPFAASVETLTWDGILPGLTHYLRVNTLVNNVWIPSQTLVFTTRTGCTNAPATNLHITTQVCQDDGRVTVTFAWNPSAQATEQWFDISAANDNFSSPFFGFGPLDDDLATLSIPHLDQDKRYYVRVNTFDGSSWAPTPTFAFDTRECEPVEDQGMLTIQKECVPGDLTDESFTIRVLDPADEVVEEVELDCGETSDPIALDVDVEYTVVEMDPLADTDVRYRGSCDGDGTVEFPEADGTPLTGTCVVSNVLQGVLTITKVCMPDDDQTDEPYTIEVRNPDDELEASVELDCGETSEQIVLDVGTEYTVEEIDPGTEVTVTYHDFCDDGDLVFTAGDLDESCEVQNTEIP
jgi:hypothetical protein